ncbi:hypothetical protein BS50DRAFT_454646, partial [Corynespora cassiicola Philippines]
MPTVPLHPPSKTPSASPNPLPSLLHTPSGLAIVELQGIINSPPPAADTAATTVGKLVFPLYNPDLNDPADTKWMKRVYFYVGKNQRMAGEVKKLGKPYAVIRKRQKEVGEDVSMGGVDEEVGAEGEELEIVELVRYKILFSARPEPVGG